MTCEECGKEFDKIDSKPMCWDCWWGDGVFVEKPAEPAVIPCEHAFGVPGDKCENCGERVSVANAA